MNKFIKYIFLILPLLLISCNKQPTIAYYYENLQKENEILYINNDFTEFKSYVSSLNSKNEGFYLVNPQYQYSSKFGSEFYCYGKNNEVEFIQQKIYFDIENLDLVISDQVRSSCYYFLYDYFLLDIVIGKNKNLSNDFMFEYGTVRKVYTDYDNYTVDYPFINVSSNNSYIASIMTHGNEDSKFPSSTFIEEYLKNNLFYEYKLIND